MKYNNYFKVPSWILQNSLYTFPSLFTFYLNKKDSFFFGNYIILEEYANSWKEKLNFVQGHVNFGMRTGFVLYFADTFQFYFDYEKKIICIITLKET